MRKLALCALAALPLSGCLMHEERHYTPGVHPVSKEQVISMTRDRVPEDRIMELIQDNGVSRRATADDLIEMQGAGVSSRVMSGFADAPVREYRPGREHRTLYYYEPDPAVVYGLGVLTGYLIWRHYGR